MACTAVLSIVQKRPSAGEEEREEEKEGGGGEAATAESLDDSSDDDSSSSDSSSSSSSNAASPTASSPSASSEPPPHLFASLQSNVSVDSQARGTTRPPVLKRAEGSQGSAVLSWVLNKSRSHVREGGG